MTDTRGKHRQRALMATDSEWARIGAAASAAGMEKSRYVVARVLSAEAIPREAIHRAIRQSLVLALLEERRLREAGAGSAWDAACDAVDAWLEREGDLARLTDAGAANRWKAASRSDSGEPDSE